MRFPSLPRASAAALAAVGISLAVPATGHAALQTFGSDLTAPATMTQSRQADTAFWSAAVGTGAPTTAPEDGQVREVRIKGISTPRSDKPGSTPAHPAAGSTLFHVQVLTPVDGNVKARSASQDFYIPTEGDPQQVSSFKPENQCISKGESVAFNTIGGWDAVRDRTGPYPDGTPFQIFARTPTANTSYFEADGKWAQADTSGTPFVPRPNSHDNGGTLQGQELLMQVVLATGDDRSYECGGPNTYRPADPVKPGAGAGGTPAAPPITGATITSKKVSLSKKGTTLVALHCNKKATARCAGVLRVTAKQRAATVTVGEVRYSLAINQSGKATIKLNKAGKALFKKSRNQLKVELAAITQQASGQPFTSTKSMVLRPFKK